MSKLFRGTINHFGRPSDYADGLYEVITRASPTVQPAATTWIHILRSYNESSFEDELNTLLDTNIAGKTELRTVVTAKLIPSFRSSNND